jgi:hypothetical protein
LRPDTPAETMARPRCDPFDAADIQVAIARGETTERTAYLAYAATAARPYARSTFALMLKRPFVADLQVESDDGGEPLQAVLDRWRERSRVKPRILSLSAGGLRVKASSLIAFDGPLTLTYSPASKPPLAIVLSAAGGFVSVEAIRFCARAGVAVVALDRAHGFLSLVGHAEGERRHLENASPSRSAVWARGFGLGDGPDLVACEAERLRRRGMARTITRMGNFAP